MKTIVGKYEIEYPTTINGHDAKNSFFVIPQFVGPPSQFGIFYGNGKYAMDHPESVPKYVHNWLEKMALKHEWFNPIEH